ncbi:MAG TPA: glycoside hydrolase family 3 C-terminal domain-containing protein [Streptosporangiaceae bacterium]|jgi:beta-glucosidase
MTTSTEATEERSRVAALPVEEKVRLLTGADSWRTYGAPALGLRPIVMSDGPAGIRGISKDDRNPSASVPCPAALGATWDSELVRELAAALGAEARGKGIDIVLAPTMNLMRTPLGGRGFECFSEDPVLSARLAVSYVTGLQSAGVGAAIKHFVGNDSETGRWTYDARIAEAVLRELYLVPFEACVREAGTTMVMAAYNAVNGTRMTEHERLLRGVLKAEWGFTGAIVSDWDACRSVLPTALAGLDLAMPGPDSPWVTGLAEAVRAGQIAEDIIDEKVLRLLEVARRVGKLDPPDGAPPAGPGPARLADPALLRKVAAASFVLLRNEQSALPFDPASIGSIALIGPNAVHPVIQGGGSAAVHPAVISAPDEALRAALDGQATVTVTAGTHTWETVPEPPARSLTDPVTGEPGVRLEFRAADGRLLGAEHRNTTVFAWWGDGLPAGIGWGEDGTISLLASYHPQTSGPHRVGAAGVGRLTLTVDGTETAAGDTPVPADPVETMTRPGEVTGAVKLTVGQPAQVRLDFLPSALAEGPLAVRLGIVATPDEEAALDQAVQAAAAAAAAVVVVGSAETTESEGFDRDTLRLPGRQDELVERVSAVNPRTVVVVNAGMPVLMPWISQVAAVLYAWLPGQAIGDALADVLLGRAEPGGRLPVSMPAREADCPVLHAAPENGRLSYHEGLLIGYRGYDAAGTSPLFAFGHGLGYTSWAYESLTADQASLAAGADLSIEVTVRNTGPRAGREVVQAYVAGPAPGPGRPVRVLGAFGTVTAAPGAATTVTLTLPARAFARYDEHAGRWDWPPGQFTIAVGRSSRDLRLTTAVTTG